ncbi:MAG: hypothetical protein JXA22_02055 [Candidatus Thermoplasmatota archaeon]|nr:hypothetical protein [Candidatus Thermoplasmatota archaeon]
MGEEDRGKRSDEGRTKAIILIEIIKRYPEEFKQNQIATFCQKKIKNFTPHGTLPGIIKHITKLEKEGLVNREKKGYYVYISPISTLTLDYEKTLYYIFENLSENEKYLIYDLLDSRYHIKFINDWIMSKFNPIIKSKYKHEYIDYNFLNTPSEYLLYSPDFISKILKGNYSLEVLTMVKNIKNKELAQLMDAKKNYADIQEILDVPNNFSNIIEFLVPHSLLEDYIKYGNKALKIYLRCNNAYLKRIGWFDFLENIVKKG